MLEWAAQGDGGVTIPGVFKESLDMALSDKSQS